MSACLVPLGELVDVYGGGTPSKKRPDYWNGEIPWVSPKDMKVWEIDQAEDSIAQAAVDETSCKLIAPPAVLLVVRGMILAHSVPIAISRVPIAINQDMKALVPRGDLSAEYLAFVLAGASRELLRAVDIAGHGTRRLPTDAWRTLMVPVPSANEQQRIVERMKELMSRADELASLRESATADVLGLHAALIEDLLPQQGKTVRLGDVCGIEGRLVDPTEPEHLDLLHVGGANIEASTGRIENLKTARDEGLISGKFRFSERDVLYNKIRPYLRKVARPDFSGLCSADMYPLRPLTAGLDRDYLYFLLLGKRFTDYAVRVSNRAGMPKVNRKDLFAFEFALPSLDTQKSSIRRLDDATNACVGAHERIAELLPASESLRRAVLRRAFESRI